MNKNTQKASGLKALGLTALAALNAMGVAHADWQPFNKLTVGTLSAAAVTVQTQKSMPTNPPNNTVVEKDASSGVTTFTQKFV